MEFKIEIKGQEDVEKAQERLEELRKQAEETREEIARLNKEISEKMKETDSLNAARSGKSGAELDDINKRFSEAMKEAGAKQGLVNKLKDSLQGVEGEITSIGDALLKFGANAGSGAGEAAKAAVKIGKGGLSGAFSLLKGAAGGALGIIGSVAIKAAFKELTKFINKQIDNLKKWIKSWGEVKRAIKNGMAAASAASMTEIRQLDELKGKLEKAKKGTKEYADAKNEIIAKYGKYNKYLKEEIERVGDLSAVYDQLRVSIVEAAIEKERMAALEANDKRMGERMFNQTRRLSQRAKKMYGEDAPEIYAEAVQALLSGTEPASAEAAALVNSSLGNRIRRKVEKWEKNTGKINEGMLVDKVSGFEDYSEQRDEYDREREKDKLDREDRVRKREMERDAIQDQIDAMADGAAKNRKQADLDHERRLDQIEDWKESYVEAEEEAREARFKNENPSGEWNPYSEENIRQREADVAKAEELAEEKRKAEEKIYNRDLSDLGSAQAADARERSEALRKLAKDTVREAENVEHEIVSARIEAMEEGGAKTLAQIDENFKEELQSIDRWYEDLREEKIEKARELYEATHENGVFKYDYNAEEFAPTEQETALYNQKKSSSRAKYLNEVKSLYDSVLDTATDYDSRIYKVNEKYEKEEQALRAAGALLESELQKDLTEKEREEINKRIQENERAIQVSQQNRQRELKAIEKDFSAVYSFIFQDVGAFTNDQLAHAIELVQTEIADAKGDTEQLSELYNRLLTMQEEQRKREQSWGFKGVSGGLAMMKEAIELINTEGTDPEAEKKRNEGWAKQIAGVEAVKNGAEDLIVTLGEIGSLLEQFDDETSEIQKTLRKMGGFLTGVASGLSGIVDKLQLAVDETGKLSINASVGDGISAMISAAGTMLSGIFNSIVSNKKAEDDWNRTIIRTADAYKMLELDKLAYKTANIFGVEDPFKRATDSANLFNKSMEEIQASVDRLNGGKVQTGTKKAVDWSKVGQYAAMGAGAGAVAGAGVFSGITAGIGAVIGGAVGAIAGLVSTKVEPVFESLESHYEYLFDPDTYELNPQILADYAKLDEDTKLVVDHWEEVRKKAKEAREELKANLSSFVGDVGKQLEDTLVNAWKNRRLYSAVDDFQKYVSSKIAEIMKDRVFSAVFGQLFNQLEDRMVSSFGIGGDQDITDDLDWLLSEYPKALELFDKTMTAADEMMKSRGYDGFDSNLENVDASRGDYKNITETTGSAIEGRLTSLQISSELRNNLLTQTLTLADDIRTIQAESYVALIAIRDNTGDNLRAVKDIQDKITNIERHTRNL